MPLKVRTSTPSSLLAVPEILPSRVSTTWVMAVDPALSAFALADGCCSHTAAPRIRTNGNPREMVLRTLHSWLVTWLSRCPREQGFVRKRQHTRDLRGLPMQIVGGSRDG